MGCASSNSNVTQIKTLTSQRPYSDVIKCRLHGQSNVSYYDEEQDELVCFICYSKLKGSNKVHKVSDYVQTIEYKQRLNRIRQKGRSFQSTNETLLKYFEQMDADFEAKRREFVNEINSFVDSVVDLLHHLRNDCLELIKLEFDNYQQEIRISIDTIKCILNDINNNRHKLDSDTSADISNTNATMLLKNLINSEKYLDSNKRDIATKEFVPVLKLNKSLTLGQILGNVKGKGQLKLGTISVTHPLQRRTPIIGGNETTHVETMSEASTTSSPEHPPPEVALHQTSNAKSTLVRRNEFQTDQNHRSISRHSFQGRKTPTNARASRNSLRNSTTPTNRENIINLDSGVHDTVEDESDATVVTDLEKRRNQFERENGILSRSPRKQVSFVETPRTDRQTPGTSRLSTRGLSPGQLNTPRFVTPRDLTALQKHVESAKVEFVQTISLGKEAQVRNITSVAFFPNGNSVLCDSTNSLLMLLNNEFEKLDVLKLKSSPHAVTILADDSIGVTVPKRNQILYIEIIENHFCDKYESVETKPDCRGIGCVKDMTLYTSGNDVIAIEEDNSTSRKFKTAFRKPMSISKYSNSHADDILVTCFGNKNDRGEIVKTSASGDRVHFVASCPEISRPVCASVDANGYLYVADVKPSSIHQLTPDGEYCRKLLGPGDGNFQHINFIPNTSMFIATENDCDTFKLYRMT